MILLMVQFKESVFISMIVYGKILVSQINNIVEQKELD